MIILLVDGQVCTIRNDVPCGCRRRCRTGRVIAGGLESIAELVSMTHIWVVVFLAIAALFTILRVGIPRSSRVGFLRVLLLIMELVDLLKASVRSFAIRGQAIGTRKFRETTANITISKRVRRLKVVNSSVHGRRKRHENMSSFGVIGL